MAPLLIAALFLTVFALILLVTEVLWRQPTSTPTTPETNP